MSDALKQALELVAKIEHYKATHRLEKYVPYIFQKKWHNAEGHRTDKPATEKALICANQIGKTYCAGMETAMHLTGRYPDWYTGIRFARPVAFGVAGVTNELTRDILQKELLGDPTDEKKIGTGTIPLEYIGKRDRKTGVPNAYDTVKIRHVSGGWSTVQFKCYEQGPKKFMGVRWEGAWLDEEPPQDILSQVRRSTFSRASSVILMTFTPEEGMTQVVQQLFNKLELGQALVTATWDDAPHMTPEVQATKLATIPEHEREMRSRGIPFAGAGLVFPIVHSKIIVDPVPIPNHWRQIVGIDFGWDHPFASARVCHDADNDIVYLVNEYRESKATPPIHVAAIKPWGEWIPVVWPPDGLQTEKGSGSPLADQYRTQGLYLLPHHFTNPPGPDQEEGRGGIGVEPGLIEMLTRMQTGRFKVFRTCSGFLEEARMYHRDEKGRVVKINDDIISACRYAVQSLRFATTKPVIRRANEYEMAGVSNWG
jgi:phage terminase large subunit-like protein